MMPPANTDCKTGSPLADTFSTVSNILVVQNNIALNAALAALSRPTIIQLDGSATYTLDRLYGVYYNLCIQVRFAF